MQAVVLAGGKGRRLEPYTTLLPKPLMPVGDYPVLEILLRQLKAQGFREVILAVGHLAELLEAYFQDGRRWGLQIRYSREPEPLGTVGPLTLLRDHLDSHFLVLNGDILTELPFGEVLRFHREQDTPLTIAINRRTVEVDFGVVEHENHRLTGYHEKPVITYWVSMGVYAFRRDALDHVPTGQHFDLPDLVQTLLEAGQEVAVYPFEGFWLDIGRESDFREAQRVFAERRNRFLP